MRIDNAARIDALEQYFGPSGEVTSALRDLDQGIDEAKEGAALAIALENPFLPDGKNFAVTTNYGNGPDHSRRFVGESDGGDLGGPTREELHEPRSPSSVPLRVSNDSQRSHDRHLSQVAITLLRDDCNLFADCSLMPEIAVKGRYQLGPAIGYGSFPSMREPAPWLSVPSV